MAVALRGAAVAPTGNPTTGFSVVIPAVLAGDWCELPFTSRDHTAVTAMPTVVDTDTGGNTWTVTALSLDRRALIGRKRATSDTAGKTITVAGCVGSTTGVLKCWSGTDTSASPVTNEAVETNLAADETHAGITPANADSMVCAAIFNTANDNAVTSLSFATLGATTMTEKLSTGGLDCATAFGHALQSAGPSATGNLTWAQTDGATYSAVWALKAAVAELHSGSALLSSGGGISASASTGRLGVALLTSGGGIAATGIGGTPPEERSGTALLSGGGGITTDAQTARSAAVTLTAGGGIAASGAAELPIAAQLAVCDAALANLATHTQTCYDESVNGRVASSITDEKNLTMRHETTHLTEVRAAIQALRDAVNILAGL